MTCSHNIIQKIMFVLLVSFIFGMHVRSEERVSWVLYDLPPNIFVDQDRMGEGSFGFILPILQNKLSNYKHDFFVVPHARFFKSAKSGESWCMPGLYKTKEREKFLKYSKAFTVILPEQIIFNKRSFFDVSGYKEISLEDIFSRQEFTAGLIKRSYSLEVDKIIERYKSQDNMHIAPIKTVQLFQMLDKGYIDYTIEEVSTRIYMEEKYKLNSDFSSLPIKEMNNYSLVYIACPKNSWGISIINKVDAVIESLWDSNLYRKKSERWVDEHNLSYFRKSYEEALLTK